MSKHHRYSGIAKGPDWEHRRRKVMAREGNRCQQCGKAGRFEVHHVKPLAEGGTNDLENLMLLCREDHIEIHRPKVNETEKAWAQYVGEMR